mmetsp:Transcript_126861/g.320451  ORF Transcript_126861/g.320451 Transcript_126861/m.320451 type:complete len:100 (+) Transcript_126861:170-469(+)
MDYNDNEQHQQHQQQHSVDLHHVFFLFYNLNHELKFSHKLHYDQLHSEHINKHCNFQHHQHQHQHLKLDVKQYHIIFNKYNLLFYTNDHNHFENNHEYN